MAYDIKLRMKNKKGQIAIWVIMAIVIVVIISMLFLFNKKPIAIKTDEINVQNQIDKCARDAANEAVDKMLPQGGFIEPTNYKTYNNIKVSYLCQNNGYFKPCISQHPMLLNEEIKEIKDYVEPRVEQCFLSTKQELEKRKYSVEMKPMQLNVSLGTNRIYVYINREISVSKNEQAQKFETYNVELTNPLYDLSKVAIEIASQEAKYCYFEYVGYMILYPRFSIQKFAISDSTKIYTIEDKQSKKEMNIAIRSCAITPGI